MKPDYLQIFEACQILERYLPEEERSGRYLNANHDILHLCFDVSQDAVSDDDKKLLEVCGVRFGSEGWYRYTSC